MRNGKRIIIKSLFLKNIRNNLRSLITIAVRTELSHMYNLQDLYFEKKNSRNIELTPSQERRLQSLKEHESKLYNCYLRSICECSGVRCSHARDRDMVYDADANAWYCIECYERIMENLDPKGWFNEGIIVNNQFEKPCHDLGWCPYGSLVESFRIRKNPSKYECSEFCHDCPVFYISADFSEDSRQIASPNEKLKDNIKEWYVFTIHKTFTKQFEKPCHELGWCPYGSLGDEFKPYALDDNRLICKIFSRYCPVFCHAEFISELK